MAMGIPARIFATLLRISPGRMRNWMWKWWYQRLAKAHKKGDFRFMNYGYKDNKELSLLKEEDHVRQTLAIVFDLHNRNRCVDPVQRRREYMKAWRIAHGQGTADSYMARKAREARARRREQTENVV